MKPIRHLLTSLFFIIITIQQAEAQEVTPAHTDSLNSLVAQYYKVNIQIFQANSTKERIDELFKIFTDDFTYIHEKYGGTYSRKNLYEGYIRNQKNGGYDGDVTDIRILQKITGLNAVAVKKQFIRQSGNSETQMTLFEFRGGLIKRITEYW